MEPVELDPLDGRTASASVSGSASATPLWFKASYTFAGHQDLIGLIAPAQRATTSRQPSTGKCQDRLPILTGHTSDGNLQLSPLYAPKSGFGIVALPWMPAVAEQGLRVEYTLRFEIRDVSPANQDDWFDVVQLDFNRSTQTDPGTAKSASAIYRVRKIQRDKEGPARLEVIESRAIPDGTKPALIDDVVAIIPLQSPSGATGIALRWTQSVNGSFYAGDGFYRSIDSVLEVVGPDNAVLYSVALPEQWANTFSMGLLDYNVPDDGAYLDVAAVDLREMSLSAKRLAALPD
jgi:hypothetical protein